MRPPLIVLKLEGRFDEERPKGECLHWMSAFRVPLSVRRGIRFLPLQEIPNFLFEGEKARHSSLGRESLSEVGEMAPVAFLGLGSF